MSLPKRKRRDAFPSSNVVSIQRVLKVPVLPSVKVAQRLFL